MKLELLVPAAALVIASSVQATTYHLSHPASPSVSKIENKTALSAQSSGISLPPVLVSGQGTGLFTTPGLADGSVYAEMFDQSGARAYMFKGTVSSSKAGPGGFQGVLLAPGEVLHVEGTWEVDEAGNGALVAVILGPDEEGLYGPKIGKIMGTFSLPADSKPQAARLAQPARVEPVHPAGRYSVIDAELIDPALNGISVPILLRWMLFD